MSFAFSYFVHESDKNEVNKIERGEVSLLEIYSKILKIVFSERGFVSALGVATCVETKDGKYCQEYDDSECSEKCNGTCIPTTREKTSECKIGTCFDINEGTCSIAPKLLCEKNNGKWYDNPNANIPECAKFCCSIGNANVFVTERRCEVLASRLGVEKKIDKSATNALDCNMLEKTRDEGACILGKDINEKNICQFLTREECDSKRGEFYPGYLCSNPELNTNCERQKTAKCIEGKDELYWIDSCGNRENIYDANKARSWNNGKILKKEESCLLGTRNNPFANRGSCGNCDYVLGSVCGEKKGNQKVDDETINYVCRDLSCVDEWGNRREHGESWCHYQSLTGVDAKTNTSMDSPGSRHFVMSCINGEVRIQPCADYRTEVCREARVEIDGKKYSQASCSANRGDECNDYNKELLDKKADKMEIFRKCLSNRDCYIKQIDISKNFKVALCAQKYPVGFDRDKADMDEVKEKCGYATKKCNVAEVDTTSGWECRVNCDCLKEEFAEKMNQLCISLGDCGGEANYLGNYVQNFIVSKRGNSKTTSLKKLLNYSAESWAKIYANESPGNFINEADSEKIYSDLIPAEEKAKIDEILKEVKKFKGTPGATTQILEKQRKEKEEGFSPGLGGAILSGPIGLIIHFTGKSSNYIDKVARGLSEEESDALTAMITSFPLVAIAAVVALAFMHAVGVGDTNRIAVVFECLPWSPKFGGEDCEKCGSDGLPCGKYACESLGLGCRYFDESETGIASCRWVDKNDIIPPKINVEEREGNYVIKDKTNSGVEIASKESDGCFRANEQVDIQIMLDKPGKCSYYLSSEGTKEEFDMMYPLSTGFFRENHTIKILVPSLEELGMQAKDKNVTGNFLVYVKCKNANGYENLAEYAIKMCAKPGEDLNPPIILGKLPETDFAKSDSKSQDIWIYTNEPAECKWDYEDKSYDNMRRTMACNYSEGPVPFKGYAAYECSDNVAIGEKESKVYVLCKDQPWLSGTNESARRLTEKSYSFTIKKTSELVISNVEPSNNTELVSGVEPMTITLKAKTSGGLDGKADCYFKIGGNSYVKFLKTSSMEHEQVFNSITKNDVFGGDEKRIEIKCEDKAGNVANAVSTFRVRIDAEAPKITRVYDNAGTLNVVTNEPSECVYSFDKCDFNYENGTLLSGTGFVHTTGFTDKKTRFILCKDEFGNKPGQCAISLRGG